MKNSLSEIKSAIAQGATAKPNAHLSKEQVSDLLCWLLGYTDDEWDQQMKEDASSGKLNPLVQRAKADIAAKRVKMLDFALEPSWL